MKQRAASDGAEQKAIFTERMKESSVAAASVRELAVESLHIAHLSAGKSLPRFSILYLSAPCIYQKFDIGLIRSPGQQRCEESPTDSTGCGPSLTPNHPQPSIFHTHPHPTGTAKSHRHSHPRVYSQ
eukprot:6491837-Amphidinium_carterae.1